jgi:sialate O-acetylesterase
MAASKAGKPVPMPPAWPEYPFSERSMRPRCVTLHHGMIAPLVPMALRGALWYQGESNADDALYLEKKKTMVAEWRQLFRDPELPFYFVQLAAWQPVDENPAGGGWGAIRDLQRRCLTIPHTGMASAIDIGDAADIHPKNKADVGERLALWALRDEYDKKDLVTSGPLLREMKAAGDHLVLQFDSTGGGLMAGRKSGRQPAVEEPGAKLRRFAIAGEDRKWVWADAVIEGDTVHVSSPEVPKPVAVRYAYSSNPEGANLYNRDGLPASPFRTDAW